jgi:hypothetical protein
MHATCRIGLVFILDTLSFSFDEVIPVARYPHLVFQKHESNSGPPMPSL